MRDKSEIEGLRTQCHEAISSERRMHAELLMLQRQERKRLEMEGLDEGERDHAHRQELKAKDETLARLKAQHAAQLAAARAQPSARATPAAV